MKSLALSLIGAAVAMSAQAATFETVVASNTDKANVILISGEIVKGDYDRFKNEVNKITNDKSTMVLLEGPGGLLTEALGIGLTINKLKYSTVAYSGICASSCAYIWLAGERAIIDLSGNAKVGFHSPYYVDKFGNKKSDNTAAAMLGGYLRDIGAGYSVITYATAVDGDSIRWLTESQAKDIGLYAEFYRGDTNKVAKQQPTKTFNYTTWTLTVTVNEKNQPHGTGVGIFVNNDSETATYVNGIRQGPAVYTFANGDKVYYTYANGVKNGTTTKVLTSGIKEIWTVVDGVSKGQTWTRYSKDGNVVASGVF